MKQATQHLLSYCPPYLLVLAGGLAVAAFAMAKALELLHRVQGGA